jgi:hypothetical protein
MSNGGSGTDVVSTADRAVSEPANRALSYGQKAAGKKGAQAPSARSKESGSVVQARESWQRLYGGDPILSKVTIRDMASAPSRFVRSQGRSADSLWAAWTNSATDIYVHKSVYDPEAQEAEFVVEYVLMHESYHLGQFQAGGGPPATFESMLRYETDAYALTTVFLRFWDLATWPAENATVRAQYIDANDKQAELFSTTLDRITLISDAAMRETECKKFFVLNGYMPRLTLKLESPQPFYDRS